MSSKRSCYKRKPLNLKIIISSIFVLFGIILIVYWLPVWIWFTIFGVILIVSGVRIYLFNIWRR